MIKDCYVVTRVDDDGVEGICQDFGGGAMLSFDKDELRERAETCSRVWSVPLKIVTLRAIAEMASDS